MSRSYKKQPYITDSSGSKERKKVANSHVRSTVRELDEYLPQGSDYKKIHEPWDIHDYKFTMTKREMIQWWEKYKDTPYVKKKYPTMRHIIRQWYKLYRNK